jgi:sterol 14-demethylase
MMFTRLCCSTGRHACPGMKIAKLEMKLIVALILLSFEYKLVDEKGRFPNPLPRPNRTGVHQVSGLRCGDRVYVFTLCIVLTGSPSGEALLSRV